MMGSHTEELRDLADGEECLRPRAGKYFELKHWTQFGPSRGLSSPLPLSPRVGLSRWVALLLVTPDRPSGPGVH